MFDKNPPEIDIMVVDEAHHDATMSMASLHKKLKPLKVLGLSATPQRTDKAELIFEKSVSKAGIYELVRLGYLARPDLYVLADWEVETVCATYLAEPDRWGKSIVYFFTMSECQLALRLLETAGVSVEIVHAGSDRERILEDFEQGRIKVLINMAILTEGFDCPDLETVFVRPSSRGLTQQMTGRVLRICQGVRKKIVQSQDSISPFSALAPIGRSFKRKDGGESGLCSSGLKTP
jgi:superfamily II DNA or RNA helicase